MKEVKAFETKCAIEAGATEIDMVINVGAAKDGNWELVYEDIKAVVDAANGTLVKVIIETCLLTDEEKVKACEMSVKAGAHFVKTSTGFATGGDKYPFPVTASTGGLTTPPPLKIISPFGSGTKTCPNQT